MVTAEQLTQVAAAQKSYIDAKDAALKTQIEAIEIPQAATADDIKAITDTFAVADPEAGV